MQRTDRKVDIMTDETIPNNESDSDEDDFFDDNIPWADAAIRQGYDAALGRCMLGFNQLDNLLGKILKTILVRLDREDLVDDCVHRADFAQRVRILDLLKHTTEGDGLVNVSVTDLRSVAGERNILAHAHFAQNPFSGEYWLVNRKDKIEQHYSAERIDGVASRISGAWTALRHADTYYTFIDFARRFSATEGE
jgi:hypothetical protein